LEDSVPDRYQGIFILEYFSSTTRIELFHEISKP
jgi:hypothetical protein